MKRTGVLFLLWIGLAVQAVQGQIKQQLNPIKVLEVTDRLWVTVVPSDQNELQIEGELADKVEAVFSDETLRLKMKGGYIMQGNQASVIVYTPTLAKIIARKGAEVNVEQETLVNGHMYFSANEGAKIRAKVEADQVEVASTTGGVIDLLGSCKELTVNNTAGGSFFGKDLQAGRAVVRTNAGGKCEIYATDLADVQTRAGGTIDVYGDPKHRRDKRIAGGRITFHQGNQTL
ncbi:head GIN domain-containing protein [Sphingobacterium humi]|uniref:Putative auto-transporter adhesin head GIN domain-containing protein n=1 Tax=Sphingobacterium humi TaxID=1796905 RepID=A0A6N8KUI0_9SPHI|nr:head GIN domain-containing protein [Sphingobacterium humi]MVZ60434.1 hypothetical protein [Sphingobacterium humi]